MRRYLKILLVLISAFLFANISNKYLFLSNSPKFNPFFAQIIKQSILDRYNALALKIKDLTKINIALAPSQSTGLGSDSLSNRPGSNITDRSNVNTILTNAVLSQTSKGVYAGEYQGTKVYRFVQSEIVWVSKTYRLTDGRTVTISYPEGTSIPSQQSVESIYGQ